MLRKRIKIILLVLLIPVFLFSTGKKEIDEQQEQQPEEMKKTEVIMFHAGSLSIPFQEIEKNFEAEYPNIDIVRESGGSRKMALLISEKNRPADLMASADYQVINNLLIPDYASWNIRFATNQLVLCYIDSSTSAGEINEDNWQDTLLKDGITWGHTDPNLDPCGYRSLMVLMLAEKHYNLPTLYEDLIAKRRDTDVYESAKVMVDTLKEGKIDYVWEYLSVAVQNDLNYIVLPDEINLGNYEFDDSYGEVTLDVSGKEPGSVITLTAKSITYGITMTNNAPHPDEASLFLSYLLDPEKGLQVLKSMGQPPFIPCRINSEDALAKMPSLLGDYVEIK